MDMAKEPSAETPAATERAAVEFGPKTATDYALKHAKGWKGACRAVLGVLCRIVQWKGPDAGLAVARIAKIMEESGGYCERTVARALKRMEEAGEIRRILRWREDGSQSCNGYYLTGLVAYAAESAAKRSAPEASPPAKTTPPPGENDPPSPESLSSHNNSLKDSSPPSPPQTKPTAKSDAKPTSEALDLYQSAAQESGWIRAEGEPARIEPWLSRAIRKIGGLENWRKTLKDAQTSRWISSIKPKLTFFLEPKTVAMIALGGYGCKAPEIAPPLKSTQKQPWMDLTCTQLNELSAKIPTRRLLELEREGRSLGLSQWDSERRAAWLAHQT